MANDTHNHHPPLYPRPEKVICSVIFPVLNGQTLESSPVSSELNRVNQW